MKESAHQLFHPSVLTVENENGHDHEPVLLIDDHIMLLEITQRCYTGCTWCYKLENATPQGENVPIDVLKTRIDWIKANTDAHTLSLIGGEPLLHPDFIEISNYVLQQGLHLQIITSGKISKKRERETANMKHALDLYAQGILTIELSFQPGRNNQPYKTMFTAMSERAVNRRIALRTKKQAIEHWEASEDRTQALAWIDEQLQAKDIFSTVTLAAHIAQDINKLRSVYQFLLEECCQYSWSSISVNTESIEAFVSRNFELLQRHFVPYSESALFSNTISGENKDVRYLASVRFRIWGASSIVPTEWDVINNRLFMRSAVEATQGSKATEMICPAMGYHISEDDASVSINTPTIRTDGELTFSTPNCISSRSGLCNVDIHTSPAQVLGTVIETLTTLETAVVEARRIAAKELKELCKADPYYPDTTEAHAHWCTSCPIDVTCNSCHTRLAPWQKNDTL